MKKLILLAAMSLLLAACATSRPEIKLQVQSQKNFNAPKPQTIEIGSFNMEWFPCKDDGEMMKKYGINLSHPPHGSATDVPAMFHFLKNLDVELLGVVEIVDPQFLADSAAKYLGPQFKVIYAPSIGSQKVGFLYDSSVLQVVGQPEIYAQVKLDPDSWLRPAFRAKFKVLPDGADFQAIIAHLKAAPSGWSKRERQWEVLEDILSRLPDEQGDEDIILMGDFNNVSKLGYDEFRPRLERIGFVWANADMAGGNGYTNYWRPDYTKNRIQASLIDQLFISKGFTDEFVEGSDQAGGMCAAKETEYEGDAIPDYYEEISDHCPVFATFKVDVDND